VEEGLMTPMAINQLECYESALLFARTEGLIVAPETSHAVAATIRKAKEAKEEGKEKVIVFNLSGHGLMDLYGYEKYMAGELKNNELSQEEINASLEAIKDHPKVSVKKTGRW
jgi:tryptophan synthase beta chain